MPATDDFTGTAGISGPLAFAAAVTPSDSADLAFVTRALHVGTGGALRVTLKGGQTVTFAGLGQGWHPLRVSRVHATGTTASGIVAGW